MVRNQILHRANLKYCQTPGLDFRLGVDYFSPLSQEQQEQQQEGGPHQNLSEGGVLQG